MNTRETCPDCAGALQPLKVQSNAPGGDTLLNFGTHGKTLNLLGCPTRSGVIDALACEDCGRMLLYARPTKYNDLSDVSR